MTTKNAKLELKKIIASPNVAKLLTEEQLQTLGEKVVTGYNADCSSRSQWEDRMADAIKLALQLKEAKTFPWTNASNVKFPLLTIAALQFLARVSLMTKGRNLAKVQHVGMDVDGMKAMQASRISRHLSLQLTEDDTNWVNSDEQAKFACSLLGSAFKKTYYDSVGGINISEHVPAMDFVVDYFTKDIDKARRATHLIELSANAMQERVRRGLFCELWDGSTSAAAIEKRLLAQVADDAQGTHLVGEVPEGFFQALEQHCWEDLDGDGYEEPYVVTVRRDTGQVLRIVARFSDTGDIHRVNDLEVLRLDQQAMGVTDLKEQSRLERAMKVLEDAPDNHIVRIDPQLFFTRYLFIPSPDGGVYGLGLGALLGPLNQSVDTLVNQLIDAGTMSNTAGGFLGRGVKLKSGKNTFDPFEWKPVDSTGNDLKNNIFPLPVREPSAVLFQLLGMLVTYSEKLSGATDIMSGISPGQNTPAETSRNTVEQGMMLFSGIYGRMYRGFTEELRKCYTLNRLYLSSSPKFFELTEGPNALLLPTDYDSNHQRIFPAASPEAVSKSQQREKAGLVLQLAGTQPGFDRYIATKNFLEAHDVDDIDLLYPDPKGPKAIAPPQNPKIELEKAQLQQDAKEHSDTMQLAVLELRTAVELNNAKIIELQAKAIKAVAEAQGVETGHQIAIINARIGAAKQHQDGLMKALSLLQKQTEHKDKMGAEGSSPKAAPAGAGAESSPPSQPAKE